MNALLEMPQHLPLLMRLPIEVVLGSTLCLAVAFFALMGMGRRSAGLRALVLLAAFAGILVWVIVRLADVSIPAPILPPLPVDAPKQMLPSMEQEGVVIQPAISTTIASTSELNIPSVRLNPTVVSVHHAVDWPMVFAGIWGVGFAFFTCRLLVCLSALSRLKRGAHAFPPAGRVMGCVSSLDESSRTRVGCKVLAHPGVRSPLFFGMGRGVILLPKEADAWSEARLRLVLLHERAHAQRHDFTATLFVQFVVGCCWINPLAWMALKRMRVLFEIAADDLALAVDEAPATYAEELIAIVRDLRDSTAPRGLALSMADRSAIQRRIRSLVNPGTDHRYPGTRIAAAVLVIGLVVAGAMSAIHIVHAQPTAIADAKEVSAKAAADIVHVECVDTDGKPVPNAEVLAEQFEHFTDRPSKETYLPPVTADAAGRVEISFPKADPQALSCPRCVYARIAKKLVGTGSLWGWDPQHEDPIVKVVMVPSFSTIGIVSVPHGYDPRKVEVDVFRINILSGSSQSSGNYFYYSQDVPESARWPGWFRATPNSAGKFEIHDLPVPGKAYLAATAPGLGEAQSGFFNDNIDPRQWDLTLQYEASISGCVVGPSGQPMAKVRVKSRTNGSMASTHDYKATTDTNGQFVIRGLPPDQPSFNVWAEPTNGWIAPVQNTGLIKPGDTFRVPEIRMNPGCVVRGTVKNGGTGEMLEGVQLWAMSVASAGRSQRIGEASSGKDGTYEVRVPTGKVKIYVFTPGKNRLSTHPPSVSSHEFEVSSTESEKLGVDFTLTPWTAQQKKQAAKPKPTLRLKVVDAKGQPIEGVPITFREEKDPDVNRFAFSGSLGMTKADGTLETKIDAAKVFKVMVGGWRFSSIALDPFNAKTKPDYDLGVFEVRPADSKISGIVVDEQERPIVGATVYSSSEHMFPVGVITDFKTDQNGRFELPHVLSDEPAKVGASMVGYFSAQTKNVAPGTTDLKITLRPNPRFGASPSATDIIHVECVDTGGKPVPKVKVLMVQI